MSALNQRQGQLHCSSHAVMRSEVALIPSSLTVVHECMAKAELRATRLDMTAYCALGPSGRHSSAATLAHARTHLIPTPLLHLPPRTLAWHRKPSFHTILAPCGFCLFICSARHRPCWTSTFKATASATQPRLCTPQEIQRAYSRVSARAHLVACTRTVLALA